MCCRYNPKKVKWSRYRPGVAQRVGRGIALLFHDCGTRRGWVVSSKPRPHFATGKDPVPILQEARWVPGPVWTGGKSRPHRNSMPDRPGRSLQIQSYFWKTLSNCVVKQLIAFYTPQYLPFSMQRNFFLSFSFLYIRIQWAVSEARSRVKLQDHIGSRFTEQLLAWTLSTKFTKILLR